MGLLQRARKRNPVGYISALVDLMVLARASKFPMVKLRATAVLDVVMKETQWLRLAQSAHEEEDVKRGAELRKEVYRRAAKQLGVVPREDPPGPLHFEEYKDRDRLRIEKRIWATFGRAKQNLRHEDGPRCLDD